ncbi:MAG: hypothetical protein IIA12_01190 [Proteobacteria bacterium]|nr:hypothetical protein [Pseudomonadota bacterium]
MGLTTGAAAQDWSFDPIIKAGWEVDDNAVLSIRTDEEVEVSGYIIDVSANVEYATETTSFSLEPRARSRNYSDPQFDSTDAFVRMNYRHSSQSNTFRVRVVYEVESVRTAERADADSEIIDLEDIRYDDTGLVQIGGDRNRWGISPSWTYRISNVSSFTLNLAYFDITYDEVFGDILVDYSDARADLSYGRAISGVTDMLYVATGRQYENANDINEFSGFGMMGGIRRALSEKTELRVLLGVETADFDSVRETASEFVANISLIRRLQTITILAQYKREIPADGGVIPTIRDNIYLNFSRRLNDKISASLGVRAYQTTILSSTSEGGRDFVELSAGLGWHLSPTFNVQFSFKHTIISRGDVLGETADADRAAIWFVYHPKSPELR